VENGTTKKVEISTLLTALVEKNAGAHNSIYRGKDITDLFYDGTLSKQIAAGTFDDIFIGDYIIGKTSGRKYLVADINYRLHMGDTECTGLHISTGQCIAVLFIQHHDLRGRFILWSDKKHCSDNGNHTQNDTGKNNGNSTNEC